MTDIFATGIQMGESPRWHEGRFWMCDWLAGEVLSFSPDGTREDRRVWAQLGQGEAPDGICVDAEGAIWYASVPAQHCVRVAEGGEVLQTVDADRGCFSNMLGGEDGRTLYVVANHYSEAGASDGVVLTTRVDVPHAGRP